MSDLKQIRKSIEPELQEFESRFKASMKSSVPLLDKVTNYLLKRKGKQMRPMFVFFAAKMAGEITDSTYRAATLVELLHTATLVHDDVVDDSNQRRGFFSINALWKNKIAVLVGDYLLSKGLLLSIDGKEFRLLEIVSDAVREMSEGELLQIEKARRLDIEEDIYFEIIRKKTASLIASCCGSGAASAGASPEVVQKMIDFGTNVGIAFQIKDDLFDYDMNNSTGKPKGIDIKEQKMTLPLIHALDNVTSKEKKYIINVVKKYNTESRHVNEVIRMVNDSGGINYAAEKMLEYRDKAIEQLKSFPDTDARQALEDMVYFTTERKK